MYYLFNLKGRAILHLPNKGILKIKKEIFLKIFCIKRYFTYNQYIQF